MQNILIKLLVLITLFLEQAHANELLVGSESDLSIDCDKSSCTFNSTYDYNLEGNNLKLVKPNCKYFYQKNFKQCSGKNKLIDIKINPEKLLQDTWACSNKFNDEHYKTFLNRKFDDKDVKLLKEGLSRSSLKLNAHSLIECLRMAQENIRNRTIKIECGKKISCDNKTLTLTYYDPLKNNSFFKQMVTSCGVLPDQSELVTVIISDGNQAHTSTDAATATLANQPITVPEPPKTIPCPNCQQNLQQIRQAQADGTWDSNPQLRSSLLAPFRQAAKTISAALAPTVAGANTSTSANTSSSTISKRGGQSANNSRASSDLNSLGVNAQSSRPSVANGNRISFNSDGSSSNRSSNDSSSSGTASRDSLGRLTNSRSPADDGSTQNGNTNSDAANSGRSRGNESGTTANAAGSDSTGSNGSGPGSATGGSASGNGIGGSSNSGLASNTFAGNSKYTSEQNDIIQRIYEPKSVTPSQFVKTQQIKSALANNSIRVTFTDGSPSLGASAKTAEIIIVVKKDPATKSEKLQIIENSK